MKNILWRIGCRAVFVLILTSFSLNINAQSEDSLPLKVGDNIPIELWEMPLQAINHSSPTIKLGAYKDKLLILEFWASWCSTCIKNIPKVIDVQKHADKDAVILPVTSENVPVLNKFFNSAIGSKYQNLTTVVNAKPITSYFPYYYVPYLVWIMDGKVINTTDSEQLSVAAVNDILSGKEMQIKTINQIDRTRYFMLSKDFDQLSNVELINYTIFTKGKVEGLAAGTKFRRNNQDEVHGRLFANFPLNRIFTAIGSELFSQNKLQFSHKNVLFELSDKDKSASEKRMNELYSFEMVIPESKASSLYEDMLYTLTQNTGLKARIEKRYVNCLQLVKTSDEEIGLKKKTKVAGDNLFQVNSLTAFITKLNSQLSQPLIAVNRTNYSGNVNLQVTTFEDIKKLKTELQKYGLDLNEAKEEIPFLVITDNSKN